MIIACAVVSALLLWYVLILIECLKIADKEVDRQVRTSVKALFIILSPVIIPGAFIYGTIKGLMGGGKNVESEGHDRETETEPGPETDNIRHRKDS